MLFKILLLFSEGITFANEVCVLILHSNDNVISINLCLLIESADSLDFFAHEIPLFNQLLTNLFSIINVWLT